MPGILGVNWTALFLNGGKSVTAFTPDPGIESRGHDFVKNAWPNPKELDLEKHGNPESVRFCDCPADDARMGRISFKNAHLSEMQGGLKDPRHLGGASVQLPHLIPLFEVMTTVARVLESWSQPRDSISLSERSQPEPTARCRGTLRTGCKQHFEGDHPLDSDRHCKHRGCCLCDPRGSWPEMRCYGTDDIVSSRCRCSKTSRVLRPLWH